jgi:sugar lactone lactonase YvrE
MKWIKGAKEGIIVADGLDDGNSLTQLANPNGIYVDELETIYVADSGNHRVMSWPKGARQGNIVVGGNETGEHSNQLNYPLGLSFDQKGNLYVSDANNYRVQKFNINSGSSAQ